MEKILTDDLTKLIISLANDERFALQKKLVCGLFLNNTRDDRQLYLTEEAKRVSEILLAGSHSDLLYGIFADISPYEEDIVDTYPDKLIRYFQEEINDSFNEMDEYGAVLKPYREVKLSERLCFRDLKLYDEIRKLKEQIMQLPRMNSFLTTLTYLYHLVLIFEYKKAVSNDESLPDFSLEKNQIKKDIIGHFDAMHSTGWEYAFREKKDFDLYCNLLTMFFELKKPNPPSKKIKLKPNSASRVAEALKKIYYQFGNELKNDTEFSNMVKVLSLFSEKKDKEIRAFIRRQSIT